MYKLNCAPGIVPSIGTSSGMILSHDAVIVPTVITTGFASDIRLLRNRLQAEHIFGGRHDVIDTRLRCRAARSLAGDSDGEAPALAILEPR